MIANTRGFLKLNVRAAAVLAGLMVASCVPQYSSPQQVQASNPTVTYKYRSEQELSQANQSAATFCSGYQSVARTGSFGVDPDGSRTVLFECVQTAQSTAAAPPMNANLTRTYWTDQELVEASRTAQNYCMNSGSQQVISDIVTNANGTKTVTFQCSRR
jgi:hypothetical protein